MKITDTEVTWKNVKHYLIKSKEEEKINELSRLLKEIKFNFAVIFVESAEERDWLREWLEASKVNVILQTEGQKLSLFQKFGVFFGKKVIFFI